MRTFERGLVAFCDALARGVLALMAAVVFVEVVSRSVLGVSTNIAEEVASLSLVVVLFLGLPGAFADNSLIRVDVLYQLFGPRLKRAADRIFCVVALVIAATYLWYLCDMTWRSFRLGFKSDTALGIPVFLPQATMVAGVIALVFVTALATMRGVGGRNSSQEGRRDI